MASERDPKVVSLADVRAKRATATGAAAHARGDAFAFVRRDDLAADDAPVGHAGGDVVVLLDATAKTGFSLSPAAARAFAVSLIECACLAEQETSDAR
jgi:hypothetical protein